MCECDAPVSVGSAKATAGSPGSWCQTAIVEPGGDGWRAAQPMFGRHD
jgi:hypothetical protein